MSNHCCPPSVSVIQSHLACYSSVWVIAYVTWPIRSLWHSNMPSKSRTFRERNIDILCLHSRQWCSIWFLLHYDMALYLEWKHILRLTLMHPG